MNDKNTKDKLPLVIDLDWETGDAGAQSFNSCSDYISISATGSCDGSCDGCGCDFEEPCCDSRAPSPEK